MLRRVAAVVMCWILLIPSSGFSWGGEGHRIVAKIAAKNLSQDVRKKLSKILRTNDAGLEAAMAIAATWPDDGLDKKTTKTDLWHFVDVPVTGQFSIGHLCDADNCVLNRIDEMSRRLRMNE